MSTLKELLPNQHITIDNHASGKELRWDWDPDQRPDDIHLDKAMDEKVNGKEVHVRVSLNHDGKGTMLKKRERGKGGITEEYNKVVNEVKEVLNENSELLKEFVKTVDQRIRQIGPRKKNRAVRKALERIGEFFDLTPNVIGQMIEVEKGLCCLFHQDNLPMYIGFGYDYAFHIGTGGYNAFNNHVPTTKKWDQMCKLSYPTLHEEISKEIIIQLGPLLNDFHQVLTGLSKSLDKDDDPELLKAVNYALKEYPCLLHCLYDGRLDFSNNDCERQIRQVAKYRNNSFFVGSPESGERYARLMSVFANIRNHNLDLITYLCGVFRRIGKTAKEDLETLLAHLWTPQAVINM